MEWVYEVKYKGYGQMSNTWEPRSNINQNLFNAFAEGEREFKRKGINPDLTTINAIPATDPGFILKHQRLEEMNQAGLDVTISQVSETATLGATVAGTFSMYILFFSVFKSLDICFRVNTHFCILATTLTCRHRHCRTATDGEENRVNIFRTRRKKTEEEWGWRCSFKGK
jgi:hypothetical protein